jgi:succinate dehydrogenase / fumarate reductase, membrane anchor subunit
MSLKSPLGQVLGLGAGGGAHHWWLQRVSSIALVPLSAWFVLSLAFKSDRSFHAMSAWLAAPFNAVLLLLLVAVGCFHSWLGVQVVIEDYVVGKLAKPLSLLAVQLAHLVLAMTALFAVLKIALGSGA